MTFLIDAQSIDLSVKHCRDSQVPFVSKCRTTLVLLLRLSFNTLIIFDGAAKMLYFHKFMKKKFNHQSILIFL